MADLGKTDPPVRGPEAAPEGRGDAGVVAGPGGQVETDAVGLLLGPAGAALRPPHPLIGAPSRTAGRVPDPVFQHMVRQFVPEDDGQLVVIDREAGQRRADEQPSPIGAGVQFVGGVELNVIAAGGAGVEGEGQGLVAALDREGGGTLGQGRIDQTNIGRETLPGRRAGRLADGELRSSGDEQKVARAEAGFSRRRPRRRGQHPGQIALQAKAGFGVGSQRLAVLTGGMDGPSGRAPDHGAELGVRLRQSPGDPGDPLIQVGQAGQAQLFIRGSRRGHVRRRAAARDQRHQQGGAHESDRRSGGAHGTKNTRPRLLTTATARGRTPAGGAVMHTRDR